MIEVYLGNLKILRGMNEKERERIKLDLTLPNPAYAKAKKYNKYVGKGVPQYLFYYDEHGLDLVVPAYYRIPFKHEIVEDWREERTVKYPSFVLPMRDSQKDAISAYLANPDNGVIVMPTGKGKTVLALKLACILRQKTLVIMHKDDLIDGWQKDIELCFDNELKPGLIKAKKRDIGEQITLATVQTLSRMDTEELEKLATEFGLVIIDECFPKGTKVDGRNIEDIKIGDKVKSFNNVTNKIEYKKVTKTFKSKPNLLVKVLLNNGKEIVCTAGHPFYTNGKYVPAIQLKKDDELYCLSEGSFESKQGESRLVQTNWKNLLLSRMCGSLQKKGFLRKYAENKFKICKREDEEKQSHVQSRDSGENVANIKRDKSQTKNSGWKWEKITRTSKSIIKSFGDLLSPSRICCENWFERFGLSPLLQSGYCPTTTDDSNRSGWFFPHQFSEKRAGFEKRKSADKVWVESVTLQESTSDETFGGLCPDNFVYNIEVEDNHNYFVDNILVHNCHHVPAGTYGIINIFPAPYKVGLSATPERADGLTKVMNFFLGGIAYQYQFSDDDEDILPVMVVSRDIPIQYNPEVEYNGVSMPITEVPHADRPNIPISVLDSRVILHEIYRETVLNDILSEVNKNRNVIVFLTQKEHCRYYFNSLLRKGFPEEKMQLFYGDSSDSNELIKSRAESGEVKITIATLAKASEGTNVKAWEVAFLVSSIKDGKNVQQAIGRIRRAKEGKINPVIVYDYRFPEVYILNNHGSSRDKRYRQLGIAVMNLTPKISGVNFNRGYNRSRLQ